MKDFRCKQCNRLLAKIEGNTKVEIKCPRCKAMNLYMVEELFITIEENQNTDPIADSEAVED
ncbi:Com family DNA-binding transcriptional regulator [Candidatus Margulisiibacteriota bacterium]